LLNENVEVDLRDDNGFTPLLWAARRNHPDIVRILLDKGSDPSVKDKYGWTPMVWAIQRGHYKIIGLLQHA
jgi:ankyrin repeat protein